MPQYAAMTPAIFSYSNDQNDQLEKVISSIEIPACPAIVMQAMAESQKDEPDLPRLAALIAADLRLSAATLKLANSALYRNGGPISGVRQAVERLGTKIVVSIVFSVALRATVDGLPAAWLDNFWRRTTQLAVTSTLIARRQSGISQDSAYTFALFRDAGIPIMMKRFKNYEQAMEAAKKEGLKLVEAEAINFSCTHSIVGSLLSRNWGLPPIFGQAIRFHHEADVYELPDQTLPAGALSLIAVTHIAEYLSAEVEGNADSETDIGFFDSAVVFLGISDDELDDLRTALAQEFTVN